jgi:hypothetical protein
MLSHSLLIILFSITIIYYSSSSISVLAKKNLPTSFPTPKTQNPTPITATTTILPPLPHLPPPPHPINWCRLPYNKQDSTPISIDHFLQIPPNSIIMMIGDSTMHEPFVYLSKCVLQRPIIDILIEDKSDGILPRIQTASNSKVQIIFFSNWEDNLPYSNPTNRINVAIPTLLEKYSKAPEFKPYAIWTNFGILHILHRLPLDNMTRHGDAEGFLHLREWLIQDSQAMASTFSRVVIDTPYAICTSHLPTDQIHWVQQFTQNPTKLIDPCLQYYPGNEGKQYCSTGAAIPKNVAQLSKNIQTIIQNDLQQQLNKKLHGKGGGGFGWLDSHNITTNRCDLTGDGQHYRSVVPLEVEAFLKFIVGS